MEALLEKLRYKPGMRVYLVDAPAGYEAAIRAASVVRLRKPGKKLDLVHAFFTRLGQVERTVRSLLPHLGPTVIVWLSYPKARQLATDLDRDILTAAVEGMGLHGVAIVAIDPIWSALRCKAGGPAFAPDGNPESGRQRGGLPLSLRPGAGRGGGGRSRATGRRRSRA